MFCSFLLMRERVLGSWSQLLVLDLGNFRLLKNMARVSRNTISFSRCFHFRAVISMGTEILKDGFVNCLGNPSWFEKLYMTLKRDLG